MLTADGFHLDGRGLPVAVQRGEGVGQWSADPRDRRFRDGLRGATSLHNRPSERSAGLLPGVGILLAVMLVCPSFGLTAQPARPEVVSRSLAGTEAGVILGRGVVDPTGDDVGPLVDVLVGKDGKPLAGVIDVGGFFGVGTRRVAVAWRLLRFVPDNGETHVHLDLTLDSAAAAPEYLGPDNTLIVIDLPAP